MIYALLALLAFCAYLGWWQWLYVHVPVPPVGELLIPFVAKFNAPLPKLARKVNSPTAANYGVTLPHPFKRCAIASFAEAWCRKQHLTHEAGGHGTELARLGPVNYLPSYIWHSFVLRKGPKKNQWEFEADRHVPELQKWYPDIGRVP